LINRLIKQWKVGHAPLHLLLRAVYKSKQRVIQRISEVGILWIAWLRMRSSDSLIATKTAYEFVSKADAQLHLGMDEGIDDACFVVFNGFEEILVWALEVVMENHPGWMDPKIQGYQVEDHPHACP
jgi:hypothetical protein